jgi:hypothetical protein
MTMLSRIVWSVLIGSLIAMVWVGYKRGTFNQAGEKMRVGADRARGGLQTAGDRARERYMTARDRVRERMTAARDRGREGIESFGATAREKATQAGSRVERPQ